MAAIRKRTQTGVKPLSITRYDVRCGAAFLCESLPILHPGHGQYNRSGNEEFQCAGSGDCVFHIEAAGGDGGAEVFDRFQLSCS
jgi:hypothetical protein